MSTIKAANIQNPSAASAAIVLDTSGNVNIDSNTLYVDATNNRVGIGTTSPAFSNGDGLEIQRDGTACLRLDDNTNSKAGEIYADSTGLNLDARGTSAVLNFDIGGSTKATLDNSGRLLVGTSSSSDYNQYGSAPILQVIEKGGNNSAIGIERADGANASDGTLKFRKSRASSPGGVTSVASGDGIGSIQFFGTDGTNEIQAANIAAVVDGTPGANDMPGRLVFSTTADGASSPTERMRIINNGGVFLGVTSSTTQDPINDNYAGITFNDYRGTSYVGYIAATRAAGTILDVNRKTNDGTLIIFYQDGASEGSISVSGTTVSYNGAHLSRWSQLPSGAERTEILRGSVLSNIDEMCEWGDEENEQLNRMKVSDVEGDKNVAGVFQAWDDDDDTYTNDFYCAMTGDFIIRIAEGVTVERGDLLMSAGDGTAKPQDDDIIRSKTIAKVISTNVSCTYDDGSYCVPCVLMAC